MKRSVRLLALLLSVLMLVPILSLTALGAVEEKIYLEEDFNQFAENGNPQTGATLSAVPTYATVERRAPSDLAVNVPFRGSVADKSTMSGNPDKSLIARNPEITPDEGPFEISIDYYPHYVELAAEDCGYAYTGARQDPTVECQFSRITHGAAATGVSFISLFILNVRTGELTNVGTPVANAVGLTNDAWNTVKLIVDPVRGTYMTYVNGALYATDGYISRGNDNTGCTNVTVPAGTLIALKCNKNIGAYNANESYEDITSVSVDNISVRRYTETVTFTVDGVETEVLKNTVYTLAKEGYTLDYAVVTPEGAEPYVTVTTEINASVNTEIECHWLEGVFFGYQSFDRLPTGGALSKQHGFASVPVYSTVMSESVGEGVSNGFVRVPFVGGEASSTTSNWDKSIQVNHTALDDGESFTLETRYRPHYSAAVGGAPTVEAQLYSYSFVDKNGTPYGNGTYLNLYVLNLATGIIGNCGTVVENAPRMVMDEWNTVKLVFYPKSVSFKLYLNGELYSVQENLACLYYNNGFVSLFDCTDLKTGANQFIVAKCNKNNGAYTSLDNAENASYCDVDDVRVYATPKVTLTVDGEELRVGNGQIYGLTQEGEKLLWADVTRPGEATERIYEDSITATDGTVVRTVKVGIDSAGSELRMNAPDGVRFLTAIDRELMDALLENGEVESVRVGTLIIPKLSLASLNDLTHAALDAQGITYLEVAGEVGRWYRTDAESYTLAGSIAYVKQANYNLALVGVGFLEVTAKDGKTYFVYAVNGMSEVTDTSIAGEAKMMMEGSTMTDAQKEQIKHFADAYVGDLLALYRKDLEGLNVLAFGDSLFAGTIGYDQSTQWVNKLGIDCSWNLTNLGIGSMTVSHTKYNNLPERGNKNSMYDWLFNGKNDFRWNSSAMGVSPNPFFKTGNCTDDKGDVDLIILEGGCNDYGTAISAPLGTVDSRDPATFLGAWNLITEKLLADYPNATIVFLTTWRLGPQTREEDALTSIEFSESVITLYEEKYADNGRIALINAGDPAVSGVDMRDATWRTEFSTDAYHLKDTGMAVMAEHMLPLLWNIIREKRAGK